MRKGVTFEPLTPPEVRRIALKDLRDLATREGLAGEGLRLAGTPAIVEALVRDGYDNVSERVPSSARWSVERQLRLRVDDN